MSINPGATIKPAASKISAFFAFSEHLPAGASSAMRSPSSNTSIAASVFVAGSRTRPFLRRSMRGVLYVFLIDRAAIPRSVRFRVAGKLLVVFGTSSRQQKQQRHAHRDSVGHLLEDAGLRAVGDFRRNLDAAIQGTRVQHDCVGLGVAQSCRA